MTYETGHFAYPQEYIGHFSLPNKKKNYFQLKMLSYYFLNKPFYFNWFKTP